MTQITVKDASSANVAVARVVDTGQAAEANSLPVVLPATQVATLTPPAAITGFATEATAAAAAASLAGMDDWDESDRAKVNLIAGQAGVAGGAGAVGASTQRVVLATDVPLPAGEAHVGQVGGTVANPSANFTRPADTTAYAVGDLVANSTTAGSVAAMSLTMARVAAGSFTVRRMKLHKSGTSLTNASFRAHLFRAAPGTVTNGDNGAFSVSGVADYVGAFDVVMDRAFTDGACGFGLPVSGAESSIKLASGQALFVLLEARAIYTPASAETFTLTADVLQD